jgi:lipoprotein-anchoring transpeptidase ErfK/SrfK
LAAAIVVMFLVASPQQSAAAGKLEVRIDLSQQRMQVKVAGRPAYRWSVSTARRGYHTPTGTYRPVRLEKKWYSRKYDNAPMPNSIFFYGGYAIHGTNDIKSLGRPASHGCIRLHPDNASTLFQLVQRYGGAATRITITR